MYHRPKFVDVARQHNVSPFFFSDQNKALRPCHCMSFLVLWYLSCSCWKNDSERDIITWCPRCQSKKKKKTTTPWDARAWIRHTIAFLELPKPARSLPFISTILNTNIWWTFCQQVRKGEGFIFTPVDRLSWKGYLRWMDVDDARRQVQTPDRLGQIPAPHWASSNLIPGQEQFRPRSTAAGGVRRRIHLTMSYSCRKMQVLGHIGSEHPPHRAIGSWNKRRRRSGKTPGERRRTRKSGRCLAHCPYLRSHGGTRHPAPGNTSHSWGRSWRWHKEAKESRWQLHEVQIEPLRFWQMPSACMDTNVESAAHPTTQHDSGRPNEVVAAEHPIASKADRRPALLRLAMEGHALTRLQTLRHSYFSHFWTASMMNKGVHASLRHVEPEHR